jgi:hypothetical protein
MEKVKRRQDRGGHATGANTENQQKRPIGAFSWSVKG